MDFALSEGVYQTVLDNGLVVILKNIPGHIVSVNLAVKAGSKDEGQHLGKGLSHYLEHLVFKGTKNRTGDMIDFEIENASGQHNAYTSWDQTVYYITGLRSGLPVYLDILADMAFNATLEDAFLIEEQGVILEEMKLYHDKPRSFLWQMLLWSEFNHSPLRYPVIGFSEEFKKITKDDVLEYYKTYYVPNNMVLLVVGDILIDETLRQVKSFFEVYPRQLAPFHANTFECAQKESFTLRLKNIQNHVYGVLKYRVPYFDISYNAAFELLASILGSSETSLLWKRLRKQLKIVHNISCSYDQLGSQGSLSIHYACDASDIEKVESEVESVIASLKVKLISSILIERFKTQAEMNLLLSLTTVQEQAAVLLDNYLTHGQLSYSEIYYQQLKTVKALDIQKAVQLFLHDWNCIKATVEPGKNELNLDILPANLPLNYAKEANPSDFVNFCSLFQNPEFKNLSQASGAYPNFQKQLIGSSLYAYYQKDNKLPIVHLSVSLKAGVAYETDCGYGSTALLGAVIKRVRSDILEKIENLGGYCDDHISEHGLSFTLTILKDHFERGISLFSQLFDFQPNTACEKIFKQEKKHQIEAIQHAANKIETYTFWEMRKLALSNTPYAFPSLGSLETVRQINLDALRKLWDRLYVSENIKIVITGAFDEKAIAQYLAPLVNTIPVKSINYSEVATLPTPRQGFHVRKLEGKQQAFACQSYIMPGSATRGMMPYIKGVMQKMMNGMGSPLFKFLREEGLVYAAGAVFIAGWESGVWTFYAGTSPDEANIQTIFKAFDQEVESLKAGTFSIETFDRAKIALKLELLSRQQDFINRGSVASGHLILGDSVNEWIDYEKYINNVEVKDIQLVAQKYFNCHQKIQLVTKN